MVKHIYKNFLTDPNEYELAQKYWIELCQSILDELRAIELWRPWVNTHYANVTPFQDGNPIYSLVSDASGKGLRIIQHQPISDDLEIAAWIDTFGEEESYSINELVIALSLSHESAEKASLLIRHWFDDKTTLQKMEECINLLNPQFASLRKSQPREVN